MLLYLIRHAEAVDAVPDSARALSVKGRQQVARLATFLARSGEFQPSEVWHSSLVRARETAGLLVRGANLTAPVREMAGLTPDDDPRAIVPALERATRPVALVGHEPYLSALASLLVAGDTEPVVFAMKKGATLALERAGSRWVVRWHLEPEMLG